MRATKIIRKAGPAAVALVIFLASCGSPALQDGEYVVYGPNADGEGWYPVLETRVEDSSIVEANFDYVNVNSELRSEQAVWDRRYGSSYGTTAEEAYESFAESFRENETFTPSEHSFNSMVLADMEALSNAVIEAARAGESGTYRLGSEGREPVATAELSTTEQQLYDAVYSMINPDSPVRVSRSVRSGSVTQPEVGAIAAVSQHELATEAGMRVLERGGTAADAVFAMSSVLTVVEPMLSSVFGGGTWMLYYDAASGETSAYGGVGPAPMAATIERFQDRSYFSRPGIHRSIVPGAWAGWMALLRDHGARPLGELTADAERIARDGHPLSSISRLYLGSRENQVRQWPDTADIYIRNNRLLAAGDVVRHENLAETFTEVTRAYENARGRGEIEALNAAEDYFYRGPIAERIAAYSRENQGLLTFSDFANMERVQAEEPIAIDYRGYQVIQNPPNSQGIAMLQALGMMRSFDFSNLQVHSAETVHRQAEALKLAFADRERFIGDPNFVDIDVDYLISDDYLARQAGLISPNRVRRWPMNDLLSGPTPGHTTTMHVIDRYGNAAAVTTSIGIVFMVAGDTGIHMNERMTFMSNDPDSPNAIEPGKRVRHTSMPYMVFRDDRPYILGGVTGADYQPQGQLQQVMGILDFGMTAQEVVDMPRFDVRSFPTTYFPYNVQNTLLFESGFPQATRNALANRGHNVGTGTYWGHATAIVIEDHAGGLIQTGAEPRQVPALGLVGR
ncbi:MAG: gamma-glutamyltransferase [Spirochaetaceae bacterium]